MLLQVADTISKVYNELISSGTYNIFYNLLIGIAGIYITIWIVYGSIKVMKGDENLNSLGYSVGKFCILYLFIVSILYPRPNPIKEIFDGIALTVTGEFGAQEAFIVGSYSDSVSMGWQQINTEWDNAFSEINLTGAPKELDHLATKFAKEYTYNRNTFKLNVKQYYQEQVQNKIKAAWTGVREAEKTYDSFCIKKKGTFGIGKEYYTTDTCNNYKKDIENAKEKVTLANKEFAEVSVKAEQIADKIIAEYDEKKKKANEKSSFFGIGNIINAAISLFLWIFILIGTTIPMLLLFFYVLELGITFIIAVCSLLASLPIAVAALLYGKWFKDIFQKWFALSVGNFIIIPIVCVSLGIVIQEFSKLNFNVFGQIFVSTPTANIGEVITLAVLGSDKNILKWGDLFSHVEGILKLVVIYWLTKTLLTALKKFLDELVGNSFNFTSGAGAMGAAATMALGAGAVSAGANIAKAGVGAASVVGNTAGSALGAASRATIGMGANLAATGKEMGGIKGGAMRMAGNLMKAAGGTGMIGGALTKGVSGVAKQLSGKQGAIGANMAKKAAKGLNSTVKIGDAITGGHGAKTLDKLKSSKIGSSVSSQVLAGKETFNKMAGKDAKPATGPTK